MKTSRKVLLTIAAGASLAASIPAFAGDWDHGDGRGRWQHHEERHGSYGPPHVVYAPAPVYYYGPPQVVYAPAPVYYGPPQVVYAPAPAYYSQPEPAPVYAASPNVGQVGGAIAGAVIGSRFGRGDGRLGATAIGTFLGAMIGGRM